MGDNHIRKFEGLGAVRRPPMSALDADPGYYRARFELRGQAPKRAPARQRAADRFRDHEKLQQPEMRDFEPVGIKKIEHLKQFEQGKVPVFALTSSSKCNEE